MLLATNTTAVATLMPWYLLQKYSISQKGEYEQCCQHCIGAFCVAFLSAGLLSVKTTSSITGL